MGLTKKEDQLTLEGQKVKIDGKGEKLMDGDETIPGSKKVQLLEERGLTSRFIQAKIEDEGNLIVEGQDVGEASQNGLAMEITLVGWSQSDGRDEGVVDGYDRTGIQD